MKNWKWTLNKKKENVCSLGEGIIVNDTQLKDPNDDKNTWLGAIFLGDNHALEEWFEY